MSDPVFRGSCLCKSVRYEVRPPFIRFAHCYCSRCRKATGGRRATNIAVVPDQFRWVSGEELISRYDLPEARSFARQICKRCNCPVPHKSRGGEQVIVPAGTLDDDPGSQAVRSSELGQPGRLGHGRRVPSASFRVAVRDHLEKLTNSAAPENPYVCRSITNGCCCNDRKRLLVQLRS